MATAESVKAKMRALIDVANATTGKSDTDLSSAVDSLIAGFGGSGGGTGEEWIGDGNTHIWITLSEGRTSPMLGVGVNGTVTVDWGDGTTPDILTGTSTSTVVWTPTHNYAKPGDYVITLTVDGEMEFLGDSTTYSYILRHSENDNPINTIYRHAVRKIEVSKSVTNIRNYAFYSCRALASVVIPNSVKTIQDHAFDACYSLVPFVIPNSVTNIGGCSFYNCISLASVVIPNSVTRISSDAFHGCIGIRFFDFSTYTAIPSLGNVNAFADIAPDCEFRVPAALYDKWIAATNWVTYADRIVAV